MKKMFILFGLIAVLALVGCSSQGQDQEFLEPGVTTSTLSEKVDMMSLPSDAELVINPSSSTVKWHAEKIVGNKHDGTVPVSLGELNFVDGKASGNFVLDMKGMTADGDGVLKHLKNEDFFNVEVYPTSVFVLKSLEKSGDGYTAVGDLTILDKTNEITFPAQLSYADGKVMAKAKFSIDRTLWGIKYGSGSVFSELGDSAIRDNIDFDLDLVFG